MFPEVVTPLEGDELETVLNIFDAAGVPGCVASIDCTHLKLGNCPDAVKISCTGKEGDPTLSFECAVDPRLRCCASTRVL